MRIALIITMMLFAPSVMAADKSPLAGGECLVCHVEMEDELIENWQDDIHAQAGIGCDKCHGGDATKDDMDEAKATKAGFKGAPSGKEIPELCASCHGDASYMKQFNPSLPVDQLEKYGTSVHGQKLKKGDEKVAQCVSCHGVHGIRKVNDAKSPVYAKNLPKMCAGCHADKDYMAPYGIPVTQYDDFVKSVHGKALLEKGDVRGAPACNDCHGNHGATPPGLHSVTHVCGSCHSRNAELFIDSPMAEAFDNDKLAECAGCHGNHLITHTADDWVGDNPEALCMKCHKKGDKGAEQAAAFAVGFGELNTSYEEADGVLESARQKGMDITDGKDHLQVARQAMIQSRTDLHAFTQELIDEKFSEARVSLKKAKEEGQAALHENKARRIGLGISTILLTLLVIALGLKIRSLPMPPRRDSESE